jgi:hypothetical protein
MCAEDPVHGDASEESGHETVPSPDAFRRNLAAEMPIGRKSWLVVSNTARKVFRLRSCCGHPGEPGC